MHNRHAQLAELLNQTAQGVGQLSEALTAFSLELMASDDPAVRIASRRMLARVTAARPLVGQLQQALEDAEPVAPAVAAGEPGSAYLPGAD